MNALMRLMAAAKDGKATDEKSDAAVKDFLKVKPGAPLSDANIDSAQDAIADQGGRMASGLGPMMAASTRGGAAGIGTLLEGLRAPKDPAMAMMGRLELPQVKGLGKVGEMLTEKDQIPGSATLDGARDLFTNRTPEQVDATTGAMAKEIKAANRNPSIGADRQPAQDIVHAAVRDRLSGNTWSSEMGHVDAIKQIPVQTRKLWNKNGYANLEDGYLTDKGQFLTRNEAAELFKGREHELPGYDPQEHEFNQGEEDMFPAGSDVTDYIDPKDKEHGGMTPVRGISGLMEGESPAGEVMKGVGFKRALMEDEHGKVGEAYTPSEGGSEGEGEGGGFAGEEAPFNGPEFDVPDQWAGLKEQAKQHDTFESFLGSFHDKDAAKPHEVEWLKKLWEGEHGGLGESGQIEPEHIPLAMGGGAAVGGVGRLLMEKAGLMKSDKEKNK